MLPFSEVFELWACSGVCSAFGASLSFFCSRLPILGVVDSVALAASFAAALPVIAKEENAGVWAVK